MSKKMIFLKNFFNNIKIENEEFLIYKKIFDISKNPSDKLINFIFDKINTKIEKWFILEWKNFNKKMILLKTKENLNDNFKKWKKIEI